MMPLDITEGVQLEIRIEVQKTMIDKLSSKLRDMEADFLVQSKLKDRQLALLRQTCNQFQNRIKVLEDNSLRNEQLTFDRIQNTLDSMLKEIESLKETNKDLSSAIVELKSQLATELKNDSYASYGSENNSFVQESNDHKLCKNENEMSSDKGTDLCEIKSTEVNEEPAVAAVVECDDQKAVEVQQSHARNNAKETFEKIVGYESSMATALTRLKNELISLVVAKNDMASTSAEERCYQTTTEPTHSELNAVNVHTGEFTTTENDKKTQCIDDAPNNYLKLNPVGALQELCMFRNLKMPKYEYFKESPDISKYTVECTVMSYTVRVEGMVKKAAKRQAATLMYHKLENITDSISSMGTLSGPDEEPASSLSSFGSYLDGPIVEDQTEWAPTTGNDEKVQQRKRIRLDACDSASAARPAENPDVAGAVGAPASTAGEREAPAAANDGTTFEVPKEVVVDQRATERGTERPPAMSEERPGLDDSHLLAKHVSALLSGGKRSLISTKLDADFVNRFRQSNNPSVRELKEIKDLSMLKGLSSVHFLERIAKEEDLTLDMDVSPTSESMMRNNLRTIRLTINRCLLTVVGSGETLPDAQENVAYECLKLFKSILEE